MRRITLRLDDDLGGRLEAEARRRGIAEADVVRLAVTHLVEQGEAHTAPATSEAPKPERPAQPVRTVFGGTVQEIQSRPRPHR